MFDEGATKFDVDHREVPLEARRFGPAACRLIAWREILARTGLVGQESELYGGFGYGNVSCRVGPPSTARGRRAFLITGTQTSGKACMSLADLCVVGTYDARRNRVESHGPARPSSESLTHGAIYDLGAHLRYVFHVHSPTIWRRAAALRLPVTDARVPYGTPEMAGEVERLWRGSPLPDVQIFAMGGHEDGIVAFGRSAEEAGEVTLRTLAVAYEAACAEGGGLCSV